MYFKNRLFTFFLGKHRDNLPPFQQVQGRPFYRELLVVNYRNKAYRLVEVSGFSGKRKTFHIQMRDFEYNKGEWMFVRSFYDIDEEYAENCAREVFDYLTKDI